MPIPNLRQSSFGPRVAIEDARGWLPQIVTALDLLVTAVQAELANGAVAKATGGPELLTIDGPGIRVTITRNGHGG